MRPIVERFAHTLGTAEKDAAFELQRYASWAVGRREGQFQPSDNDDVQVRTYLLHRKVGGAGRAGLRRTAEALRHFYQWAVAEGEISSDPFARFDFDRPFLSDEEIRRRRAPLPQDPQEREISHLRALNELARRLNEASDIQTALDATLETLQAVMKLRTAWIFLLPELHRHMSAVSSRPAHDFVLAAYRDLPPGLEFDERRFLCRPPDCSCQGKLRSGDLQRAVNVVECTRLQDALAQGGETRGLLFHASTPLIASGKPVGIINIATAEWQLFSAAELQFLSTVGAQVATALERASLFDMAESQRRRLEQELEMARHVQSSLLPPRGISIPGHELATFIEPAREVAGDFYDLIALEDGRWGLLVADVSDKGAHAAMYMAMAHSVIRGSAPHCAGPAETLIMANEQLALRASASMFVTAFYAVLDPQNGVLTYASAGHEPPLLRRADGQMERLSPTGPLLGVLDTVVLAEEAVVLQPGDTLLAFTDGVTDAVNEGLESFGMERLRRAVRNGPRTAGDLVQHILAEVNAFCAGAPQHDDVTLLALRRAPD